MKVLLAAVAVSVALATSACGSSRGVATPGPNSTAKNFVTVHAPSLAKLPPVVRKAVKKAIWAAKHPSMSPDPATVNTIEVYGPGTRDALNTAAGGGRVVLPTAHENYYLTVLYGHFICHSCSRPPGAAIPRGSVETTVWSRSSPSADWGLMRKLPPGVSRFHRLIRVRISYSGRL